MRFSASLASACAAVAALAVSAGAQASVLGVAGQFNAFVFDDLSASGSDTEGRLAVGGNLNASSYGVGSGGVGPALPLTNPRGDYLVVGGNLNAIGHWQLFNGNAVYGTGATSLPTTYNGTSRQGSVVDFALAEGDILSKSAAWSSLATNGSIVFLYSTLTLTGTDPLLNIFNVTESAWESSYDKQINIPVGSTALINIAGVNVSYQGGLSVNGNNDPRTNTAMKGVLYHFYQAETVVNNHIALLGSLLAPHAQLTLNGGGVNGNGIAESVFQQNGGEFHNFAFAGNIPYNPPSNVVADAPEPASLIVFAGVFAVVGVQVWRRSGT